MKIVNLRAYAGPNVIAPFAAVHLCLAITGPPHWPGNAAGRASSDRLLALLPGLADHPDQAGQPGGFVAELQRAHDLALGYIAAHVATELQRREGEDPHPVWLRQPAEQGIQEAFFRYDEPEVAILASRAAKDIVLTLLPAEARPKDARSSGRDAETIIAMARQRIGMIALDQTARALIKEASRRDIPWFILHRPRRIVQLGQGRHLRRIRETVTNTAPAISTWLQSDKSATNDLLGKLHFPVPRQAVTRDAEQAVQAAKQLRFPVTVKPLDAGKGRGISLHLQDEEAVREAFMEARRHSDLVIVERHIAGDDHRALVVDGRLIAVAKRIPGAVTGDGRHNIAQLVEALNKDPRRGVGFSRLMNRIELDAQAEAMLRWRGYSQETVPPEGEVVFLRATANISTGGTAVDLTEEVHLENRWMLERVARVSGLDVVGIDFITPDIARSYREVGGAICEINSSPGLRPHQVAVGKPRDVVSPIIDMLFPSRHNGRVPIAAITGTNGKTTTSRMLARILQVSGSEIGVSVVGLATTDGVHIDGKLVAKGDFAGSSGANVLLRDPLLEAAVLESARGGLLRTGLAFDWCDVGAMTNVSHDHVGLDGIETLDEMAALKGRVIEAARRLAVLNADDRRCLAFAAKRPPAEVCLVTAGTLSATLREHLEAGGQAISLESDAGDQHLVFHAPGEREAIVAVDQIPAALHGTARHNVQNAMFATGLALGLGISPRGIARALSGFKNDWAQSPGRLNVYDDHPFRVVLDSAHNPEGVRVVCETLRQSEVAGRRICVLASTGHRHNEHFDAIADIIADQFDLYICSRNVKRSDELRPVRDYPSTEIPKRLAAALARKGVEPERILTIDFDKAAIDKGLDIADAGDLLLILTGEQEWCWDRVLHHPPKENPATV